MDVQFVASIGVIAADPAKSRELYVDALGLPLAAGAGDDYFHSEHIGGSKHFGVWPLTQAAQACFGSPDWPADRPIPQVSLEFEVSERRRRGRGRGRAPAPRGSPCCTTRAKAVGADRRPLAVDRRLDRRHLVRAAAPPVTTT